MELKVGDRVVRRQVNAFRYSKYVEGKIVEITQDNRCKIKWDVKSGNGQQHSTIQEKFLIKLP